MASDNETDVEEVIEIGELAELPSEYRAFLDAYVANGGVTRVDSSLGRLTEDSRMAPCMLGIDEAGRGPVLGPMVYASAISPLSKNCDLKALGLADSKQLSEKRREELLLQMLKQSDWIAYTIHAISPMEITEKMLASQRTSLNVISQDAAIGLIRSCLDAGVNLQEVYVDTVGKADVYQAYLLSIFPHLKITVESKADATYPIVSAASIYAKVTRDLVLAQWPKEGRGAVPPETPIGSGYPGDPVTKQYLRLCMDPVFGFPPLVRSSWSTAQTLMDEKGIKAIWEDAVEDDVKNRGRKRQSDGNTKLSGFFKTNPSTKDHSKSQQPFFATSFLCSFETF